MGGHLPKHALALAALSAAGVGGETVTEAHAPLAPSSAHIWAICPGSVVMQQHYPETDESPEAREGTAAHWYAAEILRGLVPGPVAPNGVPVTAEMVDSVQGLLIDVRDTLASHPGAELHVERRVHMPIIHAENWGTADVFVVDHARRWLGVWDFKYGHRYVSPAENLQLIDYAVGMLREVAPCAEWPQWRVSLNIAQPRNYHASGPIREWQTNGGVLLDEYVPRLHESARLAMQPEAPLLSNEHCRDCTARHACPALQAAAAYAIDVSHVVEPVELTPHALGLELRHVEDAIARLEARKSGLDERALAMIRGGQSVAFYTTEYTTGREKWTVEPGEVFALADMLDVQGVRRDPEPVTPNQARAAFKKAGLDGSVIDAYANRPRGALRLTRVPDNAAKLAFQ